MASRGTQLVQVWRRTGVGEAVTGSEAEASSIRAGQTMRRRKPRRGRSVVTTLKCGDDADRFDVRLKTLKTIKGTGWIILGNNQCARGCPRLGRG
jgi:hypothetical protein